MQSPMRAYTPKANGQISPIELLALKDPAVQKVLATLFDVDIANTSAVVMPISLRKIIHLVLGSDRWKQQHHKF
jgi:hypothetical protein